MIEKRNQKVFDLLEEMKRKMVIVAMKAFGLSVLAIIPITIGCLAFGIQDTDAPSIIGVFTVFYIFFTYTKPRTNEIAETYRKLCLEELEKTRDENPSNDDNPPAA